jgi:hypothetical protein
MLGEQEKHMATSIQTIETRVTKEDDPSTRLRQLGNRQQDLSAYGRSGYVLVNTVAIESLDYVTLVDTLQRVDAD